MTTQLRQLGVVPMCESLPPLPAEATFVDWLITVWTNYAVQLPAQRIRRVQRLIAALKALNPQNACLETIPLPGLFAWRTGKLPEGRRLSILSSRLGRDAQVQKLWLDELKQVVEWVKQSERVLIVVDDTTAARPVARMAKLRHVPVIRYRIPGALPTGSSWFEQAVLASVETESDESPTVFISPLLNQSDDVEANRFVDRDELLTSLGDDLVALKIRPGSTTERLVKAHLAQKADSSTQASEYWLSGVRELIAADLSAALINNGARQFSFANPIVVSPERLASDQKRPADDENRQLINRMVDDSAMFLTHWTRAKESVSLQKLSEEELDELLRCEDGCDRSALGTLLTILRERRLWASTQTIRGPVPVVCFSAVPLLKLAQQRTFRAHRGRWDFEHYGLCIRREVLAKFGARPVIYGSATEFDMLSSTDQPWYQLGESSSSAIDWTIEQEWRIPGHVDLSLFSPRDAFVFVRFDSEVAVAQAASDWPVIAIESLPLGCDR